MGNGQGDVSFDESLLFYYLLFIVLFCLGLVWPFHVMGVVSFLLFCRHSKLRSNFIFLFWGLVMGAKRRLARDHDRQHVLLIWI